jgi:hypothetical protein
MIGEGIQRNRFAERIATTIAERNVLKRFIPKTVVRSERATVPVVGWTSADRDFDQLRDILETANAGKVLIDGVEVDLDREEIEVSEPDDVDEATGGEIDGGEPDAIREEPDAPGDAALDGEAEPVDESAERLPELRKLARELMTGMGDDDLAESLMDFGISSPGEVARVEDVAKLEAIIKSLETTRLRITQAKAQAKTQARGDKQPDAQGSLLPDDGPKPSGYAAGETGGKAQRRR